MQLLVTRESWQYAVDCIAMKNLILIDLSHFLDLVIGEGVISGFVLVRFSVSLHSSFSCC